VQEGSEECTVGREAGSVDLALQDGELVAQCEDLDVSVHIFDRQQPHEGDHTRQCQVGQSQQHDRSSLRITVVVLACAGELQARARFRHPQGRYAPV
jgi:hypothetical protein